jgi:hypothetical protein
MRNVKIPDASRAGMNRQAGDLPHMGEWRIANDNLQMRPNANNSKIFI